MAKNSSNVGRKAWSLVRLTLLWARKGGLLRRRLLFELRAALPKLMESIGHVRDTRMDRTGYMMERELSFDKTPVVRVKMTTHRPNPMRFLVRRIPCIDPQVDFDCDYDADGDREAYWGPTARNSFIEDGGSEYDDEAAEVDGIDARAEEFIAKFYEQMRLQRRISYLQYNQ